MKHNKKTVIKTKFPTVEETAKQLGISKKRLAWIMKIIEDVCKGEWEKEIKKISKPKNKPRK